MAEETLLTTALVLDAWPSAGLLPRAIRPLACRHPLVAPAYPVTHRADDNLALHHAVRRAPAGSVIVSGTGGPGSAGVWGALLTEAALARGLRGLVSESCVRDLDEIAGTEFALFAAGRDPRKPRKADPGSLGEPVRIGGVAIAEGDVIVADGDGIVAIPRAQAGTAVNAARALAQREDDLRERIRAGASTIELLGLAPDRPTPEPDREEAH
jgi:4-hydroxy-4-methyl-2-oxoglutarate aldolase